MKRKKMEELRKLFVLTDQNGQTYDRCQWGEGVGHRASGKGRLCTSGWLHAYTDPLLALLLKPVHAGIAAPILWEAEGCVGETDGLEVGCTLLTTIRRMPIPVITIEHRVRFAIACALQSYREPCFKQWAMEWLNGENRTYAAAEVAVEAAVGAICAAVGAAALVAARAARVAVLAARAAAEAAVEAAAEAARAAVKAAEAAAEAAAGAAWVAGAVEIDLSQLAEWACSDESAPTAW